MREYRRPMGLRSGIVGSGLVILGLMGTAWATGSQLNSLQGFVPDPKDVAFYYPLPDVIPLTSNFGWRVHPIYGDQRFHSGIDLGAPEGMPVLAAHSGWVRQAGWLDGYGNAITLEYADGRYQTLYAHLSEVLVTEGMAIKPRQLIGKVGSTGGVTGPHLHFELLKRMDNDWVAIDPTQPILAVEDAAKLSATAIAPAPPSPVMPPMVTASPTLPVLAGSEDVALDFSLPQ